MGKIVLKVDEFVSQYHLLNKKIFDVQQYDINKDIVLTNEPDIETIYISTTSHLGGSWVVPADILYSFKHHITLKVDMDLVMYKKITEAGINTPNIYYAASLYKLLSYLETGKKYLLKHFGHARSLGQAVITSHDLFDLTYDVRLLTSEEFNKRFNVSLGVVYNDDEKEFLYDAVCGGKSFITDYITYESEYRFLMFRTEDPLSYIVEDRKGYGPNSEFKREHTVIDSKQVGKCLKDIVKKLYSFMDKLDVPVMAFDVYVKEDNTWGLFEYNTTWGHDYPNIDHTISVWYTQAMLKYLLDKKIIEHDIITDKYSVIIKDTETISDITKNKKKVKNVNKQNSE